MTSYRYAVNVTPKPGILDPAGRAVEGSLGHLGIEGVRDVRIGRRVELTVEAADEPAARAVVERLASELLSNPLIEVYSLEVLGAASSAVGSAAGFPGRRRGGGLRWACASVSWSSRAATATGTRSTRSRWPARTRSPCGTRGRPSTAPRRSSCRAGSPTATTCGPGSSPGSARSCARSVRSPRTAGWSSASATGSRCWPRPGWCPARCCATRRSGSPATRSRSPPSGSTRRSPMRSTAAALRMPVAHGEGRYYADEADARRARARRPRAVPLRRRRRCAGRRRMTRRTPMDRCARSPAS